MKVYVVEIGDYSDRFIDGVFSTRDKAVEHIEREIKRKMDNDHLVWDTHSIEEYEVDLAVTGIRKKMFEARGMINGPIEVKEVEYICSGGLQGSNIKIYDDGRIEGKFKSVIFARDIDHARKIAYDQRAKMLAEAMRL